MCNTTDSELLSMVTLALNTRFQMFFRFFFNPAFYQLLRHPIATGVCVVGRGGGGGGLKEGKKCII